MDAPKILSKECTYNEVVHVSSYFIRCVGLQLLWLSTEANAPVVHQEEHQLLPSFHVVNQGVHL